MSGKNPAKTGDQSEIYDVAIIGGGLAGLSLCALLAGQGIKTICIDAADPASKPQDLRTTAISFGSQKILARAEIWPNIKDACPIEDIRILDGSSPLLLQFLSGEVENRAFGWIVDNHDLKMAMLARLSALPAATHLAPALVADFTVGPDHAAAILQDGRRIEAQLIIGADGRNSSVRDFMGVRTRRWSYRQQAVICTAQHTQPHHNRAVEHFWPEGPFAILPMADDAQGAHRSSVVFTEHRGGKESLMAMDDQTFNLALAARFPADYGDVTLIGRRAAYPLGLIHAASYIAPRMALVADAAHGIHPIAGQGLNLGFRDLDALSRLLGQAFAAGQDLGASALLEAYQRARRADNTAMVAMTDGLNRLFSNDLAPVRALRRGGLRLVSHLAPAKRFFMKQAMGDRANLPRR